MNPEVVIFIIFSAIIFSFYIVTKRFQYEDERIKKEIKNARDIMFKRYSDNLYKIIEDDNLIAIRIILQNYPSLLEKKVIDRQSILRIVVDKDSFQILPLLLPVYDESFIEDAYSYCEEKCEYSNCMEILKDWKFNRTLAINSSSCIL